MKNLNYTGSSKLKSRIAYLLNRKAPLPLDGNGDPDWGSNGKVLTTDGSGNTSWTSGGGGHIIQNNGTDMTSRAKLDFVGATVTDDSVNDATVVEFSQTQADWNEADNTKADYIKNKPTIPAAQIQSDWTQADNTQADYIKNKPTIPTVNDGTLTIQQNGTTVGRFSANQSGDTTVNLTGGGGSGGHTIEDSAGTSMTQRAGLQFVGVYTEDDSVNDRTKVNIGRPMTKAQMEALSSAEQEGFIRTTDEPDDPFVNPAAVQVSLAPITGMSAANVQAGIAELNTKIGSIGRTVTTLVNEAANIAASGNKTYAALTATALQVYDEIHFLANFGNMFVNGTATKEQMQNITAYTSPANGRLWFFAANLSASTEYSFRIRADSNGLQIINGSASTSLNNLRIDGVKYS